MVRFKSGHRALPGLSLGLAALTLGACGEEDPPAKVPHALTIYGEAFVEDHIPADETDGWRVEFDVFLVSLRDVGAVGGPSLPGAWIFDLTRDSGGSGHPVGTLEGGPHAAVRWRIGPAQGATAGAADADQVTAMNAEGWSVWVEGRATRGGEAKTFAWGFRSDTTYGRCETTPEATPAGPRSMLTVHADHLLFDDLVSDDPGLAFTLIADADADGDGVITPSELAAVDITGLARYQVGSRSEVTDLWAFIEAQTGNLGHIDGEGHCDPG